MIKEADPTNNGSFRDARDGALPEASADDFLSPEIIDRVKEIFDGLDVSFEHFLSVYRATHADQILTEADLVGELLEAGEHQLKSDTPLKEVVEVGRYALGAILLID